MKIKNFYYSSITDSIYSNQEQLDREKELIAEFDRLRKEYNEEKSSLQSKYYPQFVKVLHSLKRNSKLAV